jgi:hypothetical protein
MRFSKRCPQKCPVCDGPLDRELRKRRTDKALRSFHLVTIFDSCKSCYYQFESSDYGCTEEFIGMIKLNRDWFADDRNHDELIVDRLRKRHEAIRETRRLFKDEEFKKIFERRKAVGDGPEEIRIIGIRDEIHTFLRRNKSRFPLNAQGASCAIREYEKRLRLDDPSVDEEF